MNYYDIFDYIIHCNNNFNMTYDLKDIVTQMHSHNIKKELEKSIIKMNDFANTLSKYKITLQS